MVRPLKKTLFLCVSSLRRVAVAPESGGHNCPPTLQRRHCNPPRCRTQRGSPEAIPLALPLSSAEHPIVYVGPWSPCSEPNRLVKRETPAFSNSARDVVGLTPFPNQILPTNPEGNMYNPSRGQTLQPSGSTHKMDYGSSGLPYQQVGQPYQLGSRSYPLDSQLYQPVNRPLSSGSQLYSTNDQSHSSNSQPYFADIQPSKSGSDQPFKAGTQPYPSGNQPFQPVNQPFNPFTPNNKPAQKRWKSPQQLESDWRFDPQERKCFICYLNQFSLKLCVLTIQTRTIIVHRSEDVIYLV